MSLLTLSGATLSKRSEFRLSQPSKVFLKSTHPYDTADRLPPLANDWQPRHEDTGAAGLPNFAQQALTNSKTFNNSTAYQQARAGGSAGGICCSGNSRACAQAGSEGSGRGDGAAAGAGEYSRP